MPGMSEKALVELVRRIRSNLIGDDEIDSYVNRLQDNVPDPEVMTLIIESGPEVSDEEIVRKALSYKPIQL